MSLLNKTIWCLQNYGKHFIGLTNVRTLRTKLIVARCSRDVSRGNLF